MNKLISKIILIGAFIIHSPILFCQSNLMNLEEIRSIVDEIDSNRIEMYKNKVVSIYGYSIDSKNDSTLVSSKHFDLNGNLIKSIAHRFRRFQDFDIRYFFYDSLNKRIEEYSILSFAEDFKHDHIKYQYDSTGQITAMFKVNESNNIEIYPCQSRKVIHDSIYIKNNANGTLDNVTYFDYPEFNENSKSITEKHKYNYSDNGLLVTKDIYLTGKLWRKIQYNSDGVMIESIEYNTRSKREKVLFCSKWIYNQSGLLIKYLSLNKSGKIKICIRYHYEYR